MKFNEYNLHKPFTAKILKKTRKGHPSLNNFLSLFFTFAFKPNGYSTANVPRKNAFFCRAPAFKVG
jgi:hypothetical protein